MPLYEALSALCHKQTHASAVNFDAGTGAVHYIELRHCTAASISRAEAGGDYAGL
jgi:hypothetical protein